MEPTTPLLDDAALAVVAAGIAAGDPQAFVPAGSDRRWSLVASTDSYNAWVIAWPAGTGLAMHDHNGSRAAVHLVDGELRERYVADGEIHTRWLRNGDAHVLPTDHVHEVINLTDREAISVHVYSPGITDTSFREEAEVDLRTAAETTTR